MAKTETVRHVLYGGAIEIDFYPNSHRYKLVKEDGVEKNEWLKSPSGIVSKLDKSAPLMSWAVNCFYNAVLEAMRDGVNFSKDDMISMLNISKNAYKERKEEAANVGSVVHWYAQNHLVQPDIQQAEGFAELSEEDQKKAINGKVAFDTWYATLGGTSIASEFLIYSKKEGFTGRCDDLVKIGDKYHILDYKTSKGVYTDQIYQVASYMKAREEEHPDIKISGARLVHLIKDDITDKDGNVIKRAGEYGEVRLSRADLVKAYMVFKALKVVADNDPIIQKIIEQH